MNKKKELRSKINERIDGAEDFLAKAKKEKKVSRRNVLISSACSNMRVALEILINALYEEENPGGRDFHLYEKIGFLKQRRAITQGQVYKIDRVRSIGNISVHDAEREISIEQALSCLADLRDVVYYFLPKDGRLLIRKHYALYGFLAFVLLVFLVAVPTLGFLFRQHLEMIFWISVAVYGILFVGLLFAAPTQKGIVVYSYPRPRTLVLPFFMVLVGCLAFFVVDILVPISVFLSLSAAFSVSYLILFFVLLVCGRGPEKKKDTGKGA